MERPSEETINFLAVMTLVLIITIMAITSIRIGCISSNNTERDTAKACIASGGQWIRDTKGHPKCIRDFDKSKESNGE